MSTALQADQVDAVTGRISRPDTLLFYAIIFVGLAAAWLAMPILWFITPAMAALVLHSARQAVKVRASVVVEFGLPHHLQQVIDETIARLPLGEPRQLLANVVRQARPLFAARESAFDKDMERETRENVIDLVSASCATALDLWRLDGAAPKSAVADADLSKRYQRAREELVMRLNSAAESLSELYASDVEYGTPASDRVAELASELHADARARSAAKSELDVIPQE
jgi:hypothetical protein